MAVEQSQDSAPTPGFSGAILLSHDEIYEMSWVPFEDQHGVKVRELWRSEASVAGLLRIEPGCQETTPAHQSGEHHAWVLDGTATVSGQPLEPGAYFHFPAGVPHTVDQVGPHGCTMYFVYVG